jgi:hypothetical protein
MCRSETGRVQMAWRSSSPRCSLAHPDRIGSWVLEGVVLLAGQNAMLDTLDRLSVGLPGVRRGVELVLRDERWHIGFGTRLVQGAGLGYDEVEALLALGGHEVLLISRSMHF